MLFRSRNARFTQSILEALASAEAVGRETILLPNTFGSVRTPALLLGAFRFDG